MSIKHLKPRSKWIVIYYKVKDFFRNLFKKSVTLNLQTRYVTCETREIRCTVTQEMVADLESFHDINIQKELEKLLQENGYKTP